MTSQCPNCGLTKPDSGQWCECGYNFLSGAMWQPPIPGSEQAGAGAVQQEGAPTTTIPFEFTGKAEEYFKIWIVNVGLTIATLGVYSAWAKVRRKRYLYGNTWLQGSSFEYLGDPIKILKGRLIVGGGLIVCFVAWYFLPDLEYYTRGFTGVLFLPILPWLVMKARTFNSRSSAYRNIRFDFRATWGEAYRVFFGLPALALVTVVLAFWVASQTGGRLIPTVLLVCVVPLGYPYWVCRRSEFMVTHTRYGTTPFMFSGRTKLGTFYGIYIKAILLFLATVAFLFLMVVLTGLYQISLDPEKQGAWVSALNYLVNAAVLLPVYAYIKTAVTNVVWSNTMVWGNRFDSSLEASQMVWLYVSNAVAILFSLGLLIPWATIRTVRFRLDHFKILASADLDDFVSNQQEEMAATGEETSEFFDVNVGI